MSENDKYEDLYKIFENDKVFDAIFRKKIEKIATESIYKFFGPIRRRNKQAKLKDKGSLKVRSKPKIKDKFSVAKYRHQYVVIEPVSSCHIKCRMCSVGHDDRRVKVIMELSDAEKYFKKCVKYFNVYKLFLGNWGEPLLHPKILELIKIAHKAGFTQTRLSTSFSVKCDLNKLVLSGLSDLCISISGLTSNTYNVIHANGDIDLIKKNIKDICDIRDRLRPSFKIILKWHRYKHNEHELYLARDFCKQYNISFVPFAGRLSGMDLLQKWYNNKFEKSFVEFVNRVLFMGIMKKRINKKVGINVCQQKYKLIINADGKLLHCCSIMGSKGIDFLKYTKKELTAFKRKPTKWCTVCIKNNFIGYTLPSNIVLPPIDG